MLQQLLWLAGVLFVLRCVALNRKANRIMCRAVGRLLERTQGFGVRKPMQLLQLPVGHSVMQMPVQKSSGLAGQPVGHLASEGIRRLALQRKNGTYLTLRDGAQEMRLGDETFLSGPDDVVSTLPAKGTVPEPGAPKNRLST